MNLCIDETRKRKIKRALSLDFLTEEAIEEKREDKSSFLPSDELQLSEQKEMIHQAMQKLSKEHREILILREYQDYAYNEIAETLGLSIEAVKSRIFRARAELRALLQQYYKEKV